MRWSLPLCWTRREAPHQYGAMRATIVGYPADNPRRNPQRDPQISASAWRWDRFRSYRNVVPRRQCPGRSALTLGIDQVEAGSTMVRRAHEHLAGQLVELRAQLNEVGHGRCHQRQWSARAPAGCGPQEPQPIESKFYLTLIVGPREDRASRGTAHRTRRYALISQ